MAVNAEEAQRKRKAIVFSDSPHKELPSYIPPTSYTSAFTPERIRDEIAKYPGLCVGARVRTANQGAGVITEIITIPSEVISYKGNPCVYRVKMDNVASNYAGKFCAAELQLEPQQLISYTE